MSHFTVLVIGENQEEQLAPFQENNMGDCPGQYLIFKEDDDYDVDKETGKRGHWYNPNSKWDWYTLGGRWTGFFKLKANVEAVVGRPGLMTAPPEEGFGDMCRKFEIDFDSMRDDAGKKAQEEYDYAMSFLSGFPENETWDKIGKEMNYSQGARSKYWSQERCAAWKAEEVKSHKTWPFGWNSSPDEFLISKEDYIENARNSAITTHAVIKDGKWYERGSMGWWGIVRDEKDGIEWAAEFAKLIDGLPEDAVLSVFDCHI